MSLCLAVSLLIYLCAFPEPSARNGLWKGGLCHSSDCPGWERPVYSASPSESACVQVVRVGRVGGLGACLCCLHGCVLTYSARSSQKVGRQPLGASSPDIEDKSRLQQRRLKGSNTGVAGPHHWALRAGPPHPPANPSPLRPRSSSAGLSLPTQLGQR